MAEEEIRPGLPEWAAIKLALGNAVARLGEREPGVTLLVEALRTYRSGLHGVARERFPLQWPKFQWAIASVLAALGQREPGTARLHEAIVAYELALEELTRDRVPLDWALVQRNLSDAEIVLFEKTGDVAHLDAAEKYVAAARKVFWEAGAAQHLAWASRQAAMIAARRHP